MGIHNDLVGVPPGQEEYCTRKEDCFRNPNKQSASDNTRKVFGDLKLKTVRSHQMSEKSGTYEKDLTPVRALIKPHKTVQLPIYKEGLPESAD
jgi:hypothetical protein